MALLEDAARLSLEPRWDEQLGRARRVRAFANSLEINGNAISLESALHDLSFDPRLCPEHRYEVLTHTPIMSRQCQAVNLRSSWSALARLRVHDDRDVRHTLPAQRPLDVFAVDRLPFEQERNDILERVTA